MKIRKEVIPHIATVWIVAAAAAVFALTAGAEGDILLPVLSAVLIALTGYLLWFFRDPDRLVTEDEDRVFSAADGRVTGITRFSPVEFRNTCLDSGLTAPQIDRMKEFAGHSVMRISVYLSLMDMHVNRAPIGGESEFLGYFPGKHLLTRSEKSSAVNQHHAIRISNRLTGCLVFQIVGPVARRVVYWPDKTRPVPVRQGERIGMMKFGSRMDVYLPEPDLRILVVPGDRVFAGITSLAEWKRRSR